MKKIGLVLLVLLSLALISIVIHAAEAITPSAKISDDPHWLGPVL